MTIHLADASVARPPVDDPSFRFVARHIGPVGDERRITLEDWVDAAADESDGRLLLEMDIGGDERSMLSHGSTATPERIRIIAVEPHGLPSLLTSAGSSMVAPAVRRLAAGDVCVHLHPGNCTGADPACGIAVPRVTDGTSLRRDHPRTNSFVTRFTHELDVENCSEPRLELPGSL